MAKRHLQNWLRAYLEFTRETESPDAYHFWVGASIISAATRRQIVLDMHQFSLYPNLYIILVGPSGARKSAATSIGMRIVDEMGFKKFADKITGAALIKDLSEATIKFVEGNTVQLCSPMMIYSSELGVFLGTDAYSSGVIADLTDLYDCPSKWEKKTIVREGEVIIAPYVNFLAATTPQTLKDVLPVEAVGQGFTSRIMFVWAGSRRKRVPIPPWGSEYEMIKNSLLKDLEQISKLRGSFQFSKEGLAYYTQFYMSHPEPEEEFEDEKLRGYASRKDTHMLKLAMILSLADKDELVLTVEDLQRSLDAIKWMESGLPHVFAGHGSSNSSQDVVRIWKQVEAGSKAAGYISHSELVRRNYANLSAVDLGKVLDTLRQGGAIDALLAKDPRTGRYENLYKVLDAQFIRNVLGSKPGHLREDD